jgi:hypothetical protein
VEADRTVLAVTTGPDRHREPVDLCRACYTALVAWLQSGAPREADYKEQLTAK